MSGPHPRPSNPSPPPSARRTGGEPAVTCPSFTRSAASSPINPRRKVTTSSDSGGRRRFPLSVRPRRPPPSRQGGHITRTTRYHLQMNYCTPHGRFQPPQCCCRFWPHRHQIPRSPSPPPPPRRHCRYHGCSTHRRRPLAQHGRGVVRGVIIRMVLRCLFRRRRQPPGVGAVDPPRKVESQRVASLQDE